MNAHPLPNTAPPADPAATPQRPAKTKYILTLEAPHDRDGVRALRWLLKTALRRFGLRCTDARELPPFTVTTSAR
jgi:hypothetical protein